MSINDEKVGRFFDILRPEVNQTLSLSDADFERHFIEGEKGLRIKSRFVKLLREIEAEATNTMVVIAKRVDYNRDPMEVIRACGYKEQHITENVVRSMPRHGKRVVENVPVTFYRLGRWVGIKESNWEEESRILEPDPYALAAIIEEDPSFIDTYPSYCQWGLEDNVARYLAFHRLLDVGRSVDCDLYGGGWVGSWWRSGVCKLPMVPAYPPDGEAFELTLDGDAPENQPLQIVRDWGYDSSKWRHKGPKVKGKHTQRYQLVRAGYMYQSNLDEAKAALPGSGTVVEGQWINAFNAAYPQPDGNGPAGIADASWLDPNGVPCFPMVNSKGFIQFRWARSGLVANWRWIVPAE